MLHHSSESLNKLTSIDSANCSKFSLELTATAQANDVLTIPAKSKTAGQFTYDDWLNNNNEKWHPPAFREFYFYNVTNTGLFSHLLATHSKREKREISARMQAHIYDRTLAHTRAHAE